MRRWISLLAMAAMMAWLSLGMATAGFAGEVVEEPPAEEAPAEEAPAEEPPAEEPPAEEPPGEEPPAEEPPAEEPPSETDCSSGYYKNHTEVWFGVCCDRDASDPFVCDDLLDDLEARGPSGNIRRSFAKSVLDACFVIQPCDD